MTEPGGTLTNPDPEVDYRDLPGFAVQAKGHDLRFMLSGQERLDGLITLIDSATTSLKMCFYMFQADHSGTIVRGALIRAAQRGVQVHLIIDAFGSDAPQSFMDPIIRAGGKVSVFQSHWNVRYLIRNHQKFVIADDERVITASIHGQDNFPFRKKRSDLDVGLPKGTGDEEFLSAVDQVIENLSEQSFDLLFFQAGVDALQMDALGLLNLTREGMRSRNEKVFAWRRELNLPMLLFMGGGYSNPIGYTVDAFVDLFLEAAREYQDALT